MSADWIPCKLVQQEQQWLCSWLSLAGKRIAEPFFSDTILRCKADAANNKHSRRFPSLSSLEYLTACATVAADVVAPSAFIFHVSRCGSTLLSQLLGLSEKNIVLSEVPLIDELLRMPIKGDQAESPAAQATEAAGAAGAALTASIALLGRRRFGQERHLFIKLDSWHVFFAGTLRRLYPDVPFILLYRAPDEVISSHQKRRGMQAVPGLIEPELFGMSHAEASSCDGDRYIAKVLEYYYSQFLNIAKTDERSMLLNYSQGAIGMVRRLADFVHINLDETEIAGMETRSRFHAKYPEQGFSEEKKAACALAYLAPAQALYERLEQVQKKAAG
ncbi:sulfotransferase [Collimonas sp.]|uniref:sulfotransferase n=1 Tax=Collimonas sp. TaxID=1963772 RepID=UPI002CACE80F|nr:sulfotransferase [Collimonas sp.]HWW04665.1 sulfotransferase [Collimonas sp.]